ncbi:hypothetical protein DO97_19640 [Neosynechococcus sphagnicola sy1]|uniref:VOC domain-containing protein n=1 Tax=Neosynechococcus sphagnicola sy1 TaxID=1497020 RepID=A0A098THC6_9CYAN|nr:VOC family protein [Neosynechococcus sphagnicola]KGF71436.1 hypothetical protein DO97_19640 [Neosynechococcus sphagnicola sy1]
MLNRFSILARVVLALGTGTAIAFGSQLPEISTGLQLRLQPQTVGIAAVPQIRATTVQSIGPVVIPVSNMERAIAFYTQVLTFEKRSDQVRSGATYDRLEGVPHLKLRVVKLQLGEEGIELTEFLTPKGKPLPLDFKSNDHWFQHIAIVVKDLEQAYRRLRQFKVQHASSGPQRLPDWNPNAGGIEAFYFQDPDGHHLELIKFPPGKGNPRWQQPTQALFLGIDHTAIVVADTDISRKFYRDLLGLQVVGASENYGTEQEHLNNVFGARLQITALRAAGGIGVEFLQYLAPPGGRPKPAATRSNDLINWQTTLVVDHLEALLPELRAGQYRLISPGVVAIADGSLGFKKALLVEDPDGHPLRIVEK